MSGLRLGFTLLGVLVASLCWGESRPIVIVNLADDLGFGADCARLRLGEDEQALALQPGDTRTVLEIDLPPDV